jgi:hypothetical protein
MKLLLVIANTRIADRTIDAPALLVPARARVTPARGLAGEIARGRSFTPTVFTKGSRA